jgi:elongation factor P
MNQNNYEQISVNKEKIMDEMLPYLKDGINVSIELKDDKPINILLPDTVTLEIKEVETTIKGQTATSGLKPAILENGVKVMVPLHIENGMKIVVKTSDNSYVEKVK